VVSDKDWLRICNWMVTLSMRAPQPAIRWLAHRGADVLTKVVASVLSHVHGWPDWKADEEAPMAERRIFDPNRGVNMGGTVKEFGQPAANEYANQPSGRFAIRLRSASHHRSDRFRRAVFHLSRSPWIPGRFCGCRRIAARPQIDPMQNSNRRVILFSSIFNPFNRNSPRLRTGARPE
jgi:hypothetical protein